MALSVKPQQQPLPDTMEHEIQPVATIMQQAASPSHSLPTKAPVVAQLGKQAVAASCPNNRSSRRLALDVVAAITILLVMPLWYLRILTFRACPCYSSASGDYCDSVSPTWQLQPWLGTFPCAQSKLRQLGWWAQHWWPTMQLLLVNGGDWDGAWLQLGAVVMLVMAAVHGGTAQYQRWRTPVLIAWRLGLVLVTLVALVVNTWVAPGALPLAGIHINRPTMWGATRLLWATQLQAVPARHHTWVTPIEFLGMAACALLACKAQHNPAAAPLILLQLLLVGGFLPTVTFFYTDWCQRRTLGCALQSSSACQHAAMLAPGRKRPGAADVATSTELQGGSSEAGDQGTASAAAAGQISSSSSSSGSSSPRAIGSSGSSCFAHKKVIFLRPPQDSTHAAVGGAAPLAKIPVYKSPFTTSMVSVKVHKPSAKLLANPGPLVSAVKAAVVNAAQPGTVVVGVDHAVFMGCIQVVTWVHHQVDEASAVGHTANIQSAAEEAARQLVGSREGVDSTVAVGPSMDSGMGTAGGRGWCWVDSDIADEYVAGDGPCKQSDGAGVAVVVRMVGEGLVGLVREGGGCVRVVVVDGEGDSVLADAMVQAQGGAGLVAAVPGAGGPNEDEGVLSFRVPINLPTDDNASSFSSANLVILPVDDNCGEVLWSTPLLLGLPSDVAQELHQLHLAAANYLLRESSSCSSLPCLPTGQLQAAEALGQAYELHMAPLLRDMLLCCQPEKLLQVQDNEPQQQQLWQQLVDNTSCFLASSGLPMAATLAWLKSQLQHAMPFPEALECTAANAAKTASPVCPPTDSPDPVTVTAAPPNSASACTSPTTTPSATTNPTCPSPDSPCSPNPPASMHASSSSAALFPGDPAHAIQPTPVSSPRHHLQEWPLTAVLLGSFRDPCTEARYQQHLANSTTTVDTTIGPLRLLLLAISCVKASRANSVIAGIHFLCHLRLHLLLRGRRRSACGRRAVVRAMMLLVLLHFGCYNLLANFPEVWIDMWRRKPWIPTMIYSGFFLAGQQAGFVPTAAIASVLALEFGFILQPHFGAWQQVVVRALPVMVLPSFIAFVVDMAHRMRFLATLKRKNC